MPTRSLTDWLSYIESQHPSEIELGLERGLTVLNKLNLGRPKQKVITVAGTNGKGSTCAMLTQYLVASGFKVGTYTSPHFLRFNERVALDGQECSDELLCQAFEKIEKVRGDTPLTYFEFSTLAALWVFDQLELDYWVLEVGLGGRLDSVNMVDTDLAVVTSIALDHVDWLGDSIEIIGREKSGIGRKGKPFVSGVVNPPESIAATAAELGARLTQKHVDFSFTLDGDGWRWWTDNVSFENLPIPKLPLENAATVIEVLRVLQVDLDQDKLTDLFANATLLGRFQKVANDPDLYIDVAHNPEAATQLKQQVEHLGQPVIAVCGMLKDKDIAAVMATLADSFESWKLIGLHGPRGATAEELRGYLNQAETFDSLTDAVSSAVEEAKVKGAAIVVFGSFLTVSEYLANQ